MLNISEIIQNQIPDRSGNVIPASVHEGSAKLAGSRGEVEDILVALDAGTYNVRKATCSYYCITCAGYYELLLGTVPFSVAKGGTNQLKLTGDYSSGAQTDLTSSCAWSSSNTPVATVATGLVRGVAPGTATISAFANVPAATTYCAYDPQYCGGPTQNMGGSGGGSVKPTITGPTSVWWFSGQNPSGYSTSITLTSSGGASTTWAVAAGASKVTLSVTTGASTNVSSSGTAWSSAAGDVTITATVNGVTSDSFALTTRKPYRLVAGAIVNGCDSAYGYGDRLNYTIQDQILTNIPSGVPLNENWTTTVASDYSGTNWRRQNPGNFTTSGAGFADFIQGEAFALPAVPIPNCAGTSTTRVQHWGQEWRIGTLTVGTGVRVQTDTLQKYLDHALHLTIVTPAP